MTVTASSDAGSAAETPNTEVDALLTPAEVAVLFRVNAKTVSRWHRSGKLPAVRTLGGHRRFRASVVRALVAEQEAEAG